MSNHILIGDETTTSTAIENLSNLYFSLIPHDFGRKRAPVITTEALLRTEIDLLESLSDMKVAEEIMKDVKSANSDGLHRLDRQFNSLGLKEMTPLKSTTKEYKLLESYLQGTKGSTHSFDYQVEDIFRIERDGEFDRFDQSEYGNIKNSNRKLLWHGSRATNFGGILSTGLRIAPPEAPVSGYMFGKGIYLADMSSKSANYCCHFNTGGAALLLLCEAELGDPMLELIDASYSAGETARKEGKLSTWGKGQTAPKVWKDASCLHKSLKGTKMVCC